MNIPTREEVVERARMSPALHNSIMYYLLGQVTWEQAMMMAALALDEQYKELLIKIEVEKRYESMGQQRDKT